MLKFCTKTKTLLGVKQTTLIQQSLLERYDLQQAIVNSWPQFCDELGLGELFFIGQEVTPHFSCQDSIDILAIDGEGSPVIIELKRDKNKLQLLQALSYAAMISSWTVDDYLNQASKLNQHHAEELASILDGADLSSPRIVLVAESYDPEVILTADFLQSRGLDMTAFEVKLSLFEDSMLMTLNQKYPLPELSEAYTPRTRKKVMKEDKEITWEDVAKAVSYPWAKKAINTFLKKSEGSPHRRGFGPIYKNTPLGSIESIHFRLDNIIVNVFGRTQENADVIKEKLQLPIEPWGRDGEKRSGWAFRLRSEENLNDFLKAVEDF